MDYKKVIEDFNNGTLDRFKACVVIDNDGGYWDYEDENMTDDEAEEERKMLGRIYGYPNGYEDVVDILIAAGVEAEWC